MRKFPLEVCCGSVEDVLAARAGGADRVELNSCLFHGGLTPSIGELIAAKRMVDIPMMTMVRPRQGGFCYTDAGYRTALADAERLAAHGADGLVFGFLNPDGRRSTRRARRSSWRLRVRKRRCSTAPSMLRPTGRRCWAGSSSSASTAC